MLIKVLLAIFVSIPVIQVVVADDEYFKKAIFRVLQERKGQFSTEIEYRKMIYRNSDIIRKVAFLKVEDRHCFKHNSGQHFETASADLAVQLVSINSEEFYILVPKDRMCIPVTVDILESFNYLSFWAPSQVYSRRMRDYKTLGPTVLLEVLMENYEKNPESVVCIDQIDDSKTNPKKCSITFNDTIKLEYNLVDGDEYTMYPEKISGLLKNETTDDWKLKVEIVFKTFDTFFSEKSIVDLNLPVGFGCVRSSAHKYPSVETNYSSEFELNQSIELSYRTKNASKTGWHSDFLKRNYTNKMYVNVNESMNIAETIDEFTNKTIRTIYDTKHLRSFRLEDDKCTVYDLASNESSNWFYIQNSFVERPELYQIKKRNSNYSNSEFAIGNYSYLGEFVDGEPCLVYENSFDYTQQVKNWKRENFGAKNSILKNQNHLPTSAIVISTHYYSKRKCVQFNDDQLNVPKRIVIRVFEGDIRYKKRMIGKLDIRTESIKLSPHHESPKFNASECN